MYMIYNILYIGYHIFILYLIMFQFSYIQFSPKQSLSVSIGLPHTVP
jgi:hypothetical protein